MSRAGQNMQTEPQSFFQRIAARFKKIWDSFLFIKNISGKYIAFRETLPLNDKQILFSPGFAEKTVYGNIYYLIEEASKRGGYTIYVVSQDPESDKAMFDANGIKAIPVLADTPEYTLALATSKYLATDTSFRDYFIKREGQVTLNTWHGTPLKTIGIGVKHNIRNIGAHFPQFISCDYILFPNEYTMEIMRQSWLLDPPFCKKGLLTGYPRNAAFFRDFDREALKSSLGISGKKVYVYMPTWRFRVENRLSEKHNAKTKEILDRLDSAVNDDTIIFYKSHRHVSQGKKDVFCYKHILPFPDDPEPYLLLSIADSLITDYSSVFFDFACTGREIILFTYDAEDYGGYRGLHMPLETLPFKRINNTDELIDHINSKVPFSAGEDYRAFQNTYCAFDSEKAPEYVNDVLLEGKELILGRMVDYPGNLDKTYNVYFVSTFQNPEKVNEMLAKVSSDPDALLMISETGLKTHGPDLYDPVLESGIPFMPVRMKMPMTVQEKILFVLYRKTGLFKNTARKIITREKDRILPRLSIASYTNLSDSLLFKDFMTFFGGAG